MVMFECRSRILSKLHTLIMRNIALSVSCHLGGAKTISVKGSSIQQKQETYILLSKVDHLVLYPNISTVPVETCRSWTPNDAQIHDDTPVLLYLCDVTPRLDNGIDRTYGSNGPAPDISYQTWPQQFHPVRVLTATADVNPMTRDLLLQTASAYLEY
ncbi:hypothetical protein J6590_028232 [Homalodisca vitripennis]|nr:hypothetical protein J6590_028232 [Homalodisca vitripennis]